ncbi:hypothetical protein AMAG_05539 [Allomyces macrogynus ATCC 38327]|uniref:Pre-mRNA-splicing factor SYF2 n=1 Tax=Allomyces macrogynus (strain ATCC 38327) TaxID=578462 RepID=A0A0L0SCK1_ALLM3|nr:hypothetical protein AMAG_05539 [Allomyces macrogynus ATCC 38327]|eukprot:KNE60115.1 hypothetical protein AMAG_05539 [Allomyces macrogynus ATCC 38327]
MTTRPAIPSATTMTTVHQDRPPLLDQQHPSKMTTPWRTRTRTTGSTRLRANPRCSSTASPSSRNCASACTKPRLTTARTLSPSKTASACRTPCSASSSVTARRRWRCSKSATSRPPAKTTTASRICPTRSRTSRPGRSGRAKKRERENSHMTDLNQAAQKKYKRMIADLKPDLAAYEEQRATAELSGTADAFYGDANALDVSSKPT